MRCNLQKYTLCLDYENKLVILQGLNFLTMDKDLKKEIRARIRGIKKNLGAEILSEMSVGAVDAVESNDIYRSAHVVMLYHPLWDEVDVRPLFGRALGDGKRVVLPTVKGDDIVPVEIHSDTEWIVGEYNILEPVAEEYHGDIDLVLVPGLAFDRQGNRLGRGKGYYDRFLSGHQKAYKLGICFGFQMLESVPAEPFDWRMDSVAVVDD